MKNIFQRIIDHELPCDLVFENERIIAFKDIAPVAPVHILIVSKKPLKNISEAHPEDANLIAEIIFVANQLAKEFKIEDGYRLLTNNGEMAGQTVFQLHFHLIGGRHLGHLA